MLQPKRNEITNKLKMIINNEITREEVARWAFGFITSDDNVEVTDIEAWHYLWEAGDGVFTCYVGT